PNRQRIQRLVRATPGSESIREFQEVLFIDRVQHLDGGTLDNFVFQRRNTKRPELARFTHLRDINPTHRSCSVSASPESMGEILEVRLEVLNVVLPCLAIRACRRVPLDREERCPQPIDVIDMVEERSEPLFLFPSCCLTYPLQRAGRVFPALNPERVTLGRV